MPKKEAKAGSVDPVALAALRTTLVEGRDALRRLAGELAPTRGLELVHAASDAVDVIVMRLVELAAGALERDLGPTGRLAGESIGVVPVGGYGRRELCPRSDIDLLFLVPKKGAGGAKLDADRVERFVNAVLYGLWDLGFEVGHAVRTISECLAMAAEDQSVKTGLLDARLLSGPPGPGAEVREATFRELGQAIEKELLSGRGAEDLMAQKLDEAAKRRERFGNSIYLLEPNVKASEGGLRELHTAMWVARARWRAVGTRDLLKIGVLSPREEKAIERAYGFLLRVRTELHLLSGRRQDILGFEYQEMIAKTLGYLESDVTDHDRKKHGIERFMRAYYFHAHQIRHLAGLVIERATSHEKAHPSQPVSAPGGFRLWGGTLTVTDKGQFTRDPSALVRIFRVAQEESLEIYSYTKDLVRESVTLIDRRARRHPDVVRELLLLLEDPKADGAVLDVMHDLGLLRRLIPEVARMTARWQHSLYHVYTVDVHSLFVVKNLKALRTGALAGEQPELTRLIAELPRPAVLYLAGFLHDVGKGWHKGDHSSRGAIVARVVGKRLEEAELPSWTAEDTEDLVWLVKEHLTMSDISQRRDVSDHDLIESFAADVGSTERLVMLYLLTFADMKGTSPKVWSDWKGTLLHEVYEVTRAVLESPSRAAREDGAAHVEARRRRARLEIHQELQVRGLSSPPAHVVDAFTAIMPARYMLSIPARRMIRHVEMWREVGERGGLSLHVRQLRREGTTRLSVACPDRPGLLALLAGTLAANRIQILSAQIFSMDAASANGARTALDVLYLKDESGGLFDDPAKLERVRKDLEAVLFGKGDPKVLLEQRLGGSTLKPRPRPAVKTEIVVANDVSKTETVIDVFCLDRLGVLYTIARALADAGLDVSVAKISTQGDRVADGFYVTDVRTGKKLETQAQLDDVKAALRRAIDGPPSSPR